MNIADYTRKSLTEKVTDEIIQYIMDNDLKEGDRIPSEYELASIFQVGRGTIREAIRALISRNILVIRRGAGTFISDRHGTADDPFGLAFMKDKHKLALDLLAVRFMIEPEIAALAAINATEEDVRELQTLADAVEQLFIEKKSHAYKDIELHAKIAECSHNTVVPSLIPIISASIEIFVDLTRRKLFHETVETHREVIEAIRTHNSIAAHDAMLLHLVYNRRNIKTLDFGDEKQ